MADAPIELLEQIPLFEGLQRDELGRIAAKVLDIAGRLDEAIEAVRVEVSIP